MARGQRLVSLLRSAARTVQQTAVSSESSCQHAAVRAFSGSSRAAAVAGVGEDLYVDPQAVASNSIRLS